MTNEQSVWGNPFPPCVSVILSDIWDIYAYLHKYIFKFCEKSHLHWTLPEVEMDSFIFSQWSWNGSGNIL